MQGRGFESFRVFYEDLGMPRPWFPWKGLPQEGETRIEVFVAEGDGVSRPSPPSRGSKKKKRTNKTRGINREEYRKDMEKTRED